MLAKIDLVNKFTNILPKIASESGVYFEHFSMDGLDEMHLYSIDKRLYEFFEFEPFKEIGETRAYMEKLLQRMSTQSGEQNAMYWFVRRQDDDHLVGTAGLVNLNHARQSIEWGYGVDPKLWGTGYVLQIQEILKYFTFEVLELNRLYGITMVENERTTQSVLASGMKHEGVLRDFYCQNGVYHDGWKYGMIAKDYAENNTISPFVSVSKNEIVSVISSILTEEEITAESSMENVFSWDSLNHMQIIIALKNQLSIDFSPSEIASSTSIKKIYKRAYEG